MTAQSTFAKLVAGFAGFAMVFSFVATPVTASALTSAELQAQINMLQAQLSSLGGASSTGYTFNTNLTMGSKGTDVMNLQKVLNMSADTKVASSGAGSPGMETSTFGPATRSAVIKFQTKYGISPAAGFVGAITRAKLNTMSGSVVTTPTTPTTPGTNPQGGALTVSMASQPANSLAPQSASRIPFTTLTLTAGSSDVTVNSITVERSGLAQNSVFAGVVLLNSNGMQIGVAKTLNSNNQAMVGEAWVIKAGTSQTVTVAGNMAANLSALAGQVVGLNVVAINTSATVSGSLPIMGAQHTVNATLSLGAATLAISSFDPNSAQSKEIGTTAYKFAGIRVTAGSAEKVKLNSIRFNQVGSASSNDLTNVMVYVDGTSYNTVVSSDGKYYSAVFPGGISIDKGFSKDIYVQGDIIGSNTAGRTVQFDINRATDIYLTGETYMYGITPTAGTTGSVTTASQFTTGTPFFDGSLVTVTGGSVTTIQKATSVAAANVAVNVPNQVLGGFQTDFKGEAIAVQNMVFTVSTTTGNTFGLTNVTIVDANGAVVAGPVDQVGTSLSFSDTVTFPVGVRTYTLKGKLASATPNNTTFTVASTPSSQWTNITGQTTGNTVSLSGAGIFTMNTMTVKAASLAVSVSATPSAQSIVAGGQGITFANFQFDASQSGEDVRFSSLALTNTGGNTGATSCQLFDGATALNTGSNVVTTSAATNTFTLDSQLVVAKGTVKTLTLKCNVTSAASGTFQWGITGIQIGNIAVSGVTSSNSIVATGSTGAGQTMTVGTGSLVVSTDSSSPSYTVVASGSTGNTAGVFKFRATNEAVNLNRVSLRLTSGSASDLVQVSIWDGATQVGTAVFTGNSAFATSTFATSVVLPKDTDKTLTVKVDLGMVGTSQPASQGSLIRVDFNGSDATGTQGTGVGSGNTINATGSTSVAGVRLFKSFPTLALDTLGSTGLADGRLIRYKVTANANGSIGISSMKFSVATTSATVTNVALYAFTDASYSSPVSGQGTSGQIGSTQATIPTAAAFAISPTTNPVQVSAGATLYFELRASISGVTTGSSAVTTLLGDSAYPTTLTSGFNVATSSSLTAGNNFVWSGNATSTSSTADVDFSNGASLPGFPSSGLIQTRSN
ncbi:MAG: peptidoglycan-binding protein [Candidatus Zambryskibacteria bacterium]|nr:peptidoglycan-binding protein [Candidatus Zambryskibacteria bacterium]